MVPQKDDGRKQGNCQNIFYLLQLKLSHLPLDGHDRKKNDFHNKLFLKQRNPSTQFSEFQKIESLEKQLVRDSRPKSVVAVCSRVAPISKQC